VLHPLQGQPRHQQVAVGRAARVGAGKRPEVVPDQRRGIGPEPVSAQGLSDHGWLVGEAAAGQLRSTSWTASRSTPRARTPATTASRSPGLFPAGAGDIPGPNTQGRHCGSIPERSPLGQASSLKNAAIDRSVRGGGRVGSSNSKWATRARLSTTSRNATQPHEAVPDHHVGIVVGAADGLRQGAGVGGKPEWSPVAGGADPRRVALNDCRLGSQRGGQVGESPLTVEAPPGTSRTRAYQGLRDGSPHPAHADAAGHARQHFHAP
jgi:hypothetical protein